MALLACTAPVPESVVTCHPVPQDSKIIERMVEMQQLQIGTNATTQNSEVSDFSAGQD